MAGHILLHIIEGTFEQIRILEIYLRDCVEPKNISAISSIQSWLNMKFQFQSKVIKSSWLLGLLGIFCGGLWLAIRYLVKNKLFIKQAIKNFTNKLRRTKNNNGSLVSYKNLLMKTDMTLFLMIVGAICLVFGGYHGYKKVKLWIDDDRNRKQQDKDRLDLELRREQQ